MINQIQINTCRQPFLPLEDFLTFLFLFVFVLLLLLLIFSSGRLLATVVCFLVCFTSPDTLDTFLTVDTVDLLLVVLLLLLLLVVFLETVLESLPCFVTAGPFVFVIPTKWEVEEDEEEDTQTNNVLSSSSLMFIHRD